MPVLYRKYRPQTFAEFLEHTGQTIFVDGGAHLAPMARDFVALERD